ncbi:SAF domain-containing protein [Brachybacterium sp. J144]|uniref:SAF domain-containing protein n=1 Tax=Brachybacterium sp. J144 TaxID=3116487 RepID=UPI002E786E52|nr:SAF domain-containing protein [Brachybacterium sp. J144]MEE1649459.1 SAF domain-containing protein [Brachybacterium sp. J144]
MLSRLLARLPHWHRALRRRRRLLTVLCLALAGALLLPALVPVSHRGVEVLVLHRDAAAGEQLQREDLRTERLAVELVPAGALASVDELAGRETLIPLSAGTPLLEGMLEDRTDSTIVPEGSALLAVPAPAVLTPHLRAGARLELQTASALDPAPRGVPATVLEAPSEAVGMEAVTRSTSAGAVQVLVVLDRRDTARVASAVAEGSISVSVIG